MTIKRTSNTDRVSKTRISVKDTEDATIIVKCKLCDKPIPIRSSAMADELEAMRKTFEKQKIICPKCFHEANFCVNDLVYITAADNKAKRNARGSERQV